MIPDRREIGHGLAEPLVKRPESDQALVRGVDSIDEHLLNVQLGKGNIPNGRIIDRTWKEPSGRLYASRGRSDGSMRTPDGQELRVIGRRNAGWITLSAGVTVDVEGQPTGQVTRGSYVMPLAVRHKEVLGTT